MLYLERYEADGEEAIETHVTDRDRDGNIRERVEHVPTFLGSRRPGAQICAASRKPLPFRVFARLAGSRCMALTVT